MQQPRHYKPSKRIAFFGDEREDRQSQMPVSKAGRLAMELSAEKKRLLTELKELQAENEDLKSTTPTGTVDWYVKLIRTCIS